MGLGKQHSFKWAGHIVVRFPNPLASWQLGNLTSHIAILTARQQSVWFDAMKRTSLNSSQLKLEGTLPYSAVRGIHPNWWVAAKKEFHVLCFGIILGGILTNLIDHQKAGGELWRRWNISRPLWPGQREFTSERETQLHSGKWWNIQTQADSLTLAGEEEGTREVSRLIFVEV